MVERFCACAGEQAEKSHTTQLVNKNQKSAEYFIIIIKRM